MRYYYVGFGPQELAALPVGSYVVSSRSHAEVAAQKGLAPIHVVEIKTATVEKYLRLSKETPVLECLWPFPSHLVEEVKLSSVVQAMTVPQQPQQEPLHKLERDNEVSISRPYEEDLQAFRVKHKREPTSDEMAKMRWTR